MSDPVTNVEMEDVLSSIRRLVSEDSRPKFDRHALEKHDENDDDAQGADIYDAPQALVLTPALRVAEVVEEPAEPVQALEQTIADDETGAAEEASDETSLEPAEDHWESEDDSEGDDASAREDETADLEDEAQDSEETDTLEAAVDHDFSDVEEISSEDETDAETGDEIADEPDAEASETLGEFDHLSLETRIAEVENAVSDQDEQWEPDGDEQGDNVAEPVEALTWEDHVEETVEDQATATQEDPRWGYEDEQQDDFGAQDDVDEVSLAEHDAPQNDTPKEDHADVAELSEADESEVDLFGADDTLLDEDMLREMVSEIVRQELQGALGERITRNVRKLVRREIHRALASQDLE